MVILDPQTRKAIPGAANLFLDPKYPMSAAFNSPLAVDPQKVHINGNQPVKLVQDKGRLFTNLNQAGLPVGKFKSMDSLVQHGAFDLPKFEDFFDYQNKPVTMVGNNLQSEINDLEELLTFLERLSQNPGTVGRQTQLEDPLTAFMRAIPAMDGKALNTGATSVRDGVLAHNVPSSNPKQQDILHHGKEALKATGLDYGCVFIQFTNDGDFEILDIHSNLNRGDAIALRSLADIMHEANKVTNRKRC